MGLERFIEAQRLTYNKALKEIKKEKKRTHWIWFVFPQIKGLGCSPTAQKYAIEDLEEAKAYMEHEILSHRLIQISEALMYTDTKDITQIMGYPDNLKLQSCMTLFSIAAPEYIVFKRVLDKFYNGEMDINTVNIINDNEGKKEYVEMVSHLSSFCHIEEDDDTLLIHNKKETHAGYKLRLIGKEIFINIVSNMIKNNDGTYNYKYEESAHCQIVLPFSTEDIAKEVFDLRKEILNKEGTIN